MRSVPNTARSVFGRTCFAAYAQRQYLELPCNAVPLSRAVPISGSCGPVTSRNRSTTSGPPWIWIAIDAPDVKFSTND